MTTEGRKKKPRRAGFLRNCEAAGSAPCGTRQVAEGQELNLDNDGNVGRPVGGDLRRGDVHFLRNGDFPLTPGLHALKAESDGLELASTLDAERRAVLLRRAISGTIFARPVSSTWRDSYGHLLRKSWSLLYDLSPDGRSNFTTELEALKRLPYDFTVRTRDRWPKGIPPSIEFKVEHWWPMGTTDNIAGIDWTTAARAGHSRGGRGQFSLPIRDTGNVTVNMQIDLEQHEFLPKATKRPLARESRTISYTTVDSVDDVIAPVSSDELDAALRQGLQFNNDTFSSIRLNTSALSTPNTDDVAFGLVMELFHNGRLIMTAHARWLGSTPQRCTFGDVDAAGDWKEIATYISENTGKPGWTVHISTDPAWALAVLEAKRYWKGDLTFPTNVTTMRRGLVVPPAPVGK